MERQIDTVRREIRGLLCKCTLKESLEEKLAKDEIPKDDIEMVEFTKNSIKKDKEKILKLIECLQRDTLPLYCFGIDDKCCKEDIAILVLSGKGINWLTLEDLYNTPDCFLGVLEAKRNSEKDPKEKQFWKKIIGIIESPDDDFYNHTIEEIFFDCK